MISLSERRQQILDEMNRLERLQRGYLSKQFLYRERNGRKFRFGPYYLLQHGAGKGRVCRRVCADKVTTVKAEVEAWQRFEQLADEFVSVTERMTLEEGEATDSKKNFRRSPKRAIKRPRTSSI
jgi:hypothetical protein